MELVSQALMVMAPLVEQVATQEYLKEVVACTAQAVVMVAPMVALVAEAQQVAMVAMLAQAAVHLAAVVVVDLLLWSYPMDPEMAAKTALMVQLPSAQASRVFTISNPLISPSALDAQHVREEIF
jgi:hypothetical protein